MTYYAAVPLKIAKP